MDKGWIVVRFSRNKPTKTVEWFEEKGEAIEAAELLNEQSDKDTFYGWERNK